MLWRKRHPGALLACREHLQGEHDESLWMSVWPARCLANRCRTGALLHRWERFIVPANSVKTQPAKYTSWPPGGAAAKQSRATDRNGVRSRQPLCNAAMSVMHADQRLPPAQDPPSGGREFQRPETLVYDFEISRHYFRCVRSCAHSPFTPLGYRVEYFRLP